MTNNQRLVFIALLASQAVIISLLERAIPFPFAVARGAKLGLANMITIMALYTLSTKDTMHVIGIRITLASLLGGTISTLMYSGAGALLSFIGMVLMKKIGGNKISIIGVSVVGAVLHNVGQLLIASMVANTWTVMLYLPVLSMIGILSGIAIGIAANYILTHVNRLNYYKDLQTFQVERG